MPENGLALRMDEHHAQGDQGFAGSTFGYHMSATGDLPAFGDAHDGEGLGRIGSAQHLRESRVRAHLPDHVGEGTKQGCALPVPWHGKPYIGESRTEMTCVLRLEVKFC